MQVKSIAEFSKGSILQYFQPALSNHLSLRSLFCLFLSGRFTQVLLYNRVNLLGFHFCEPQSFMEIKILTKISEFTVSKVKI